MTDPPYIEEYKGFIIRYEVEAVVIARDADHAKQIMSEENSDWLEGWNDVRNLQASRLTYYPAGYDNNSLVYHDMKGDITFKWTWDNCGDKKVVERLKAAQIDDNPKVSNKKSSPTPKKRWFSGIMNFITGKNKE